MRETLIDKYRDINTDHMWWEHIYDSFRADMRRDYGVTVGQMYFSGFWSQGDGAQFELRGWHSIWELLCGLGRQAKYAPWWEGDDHQYKIGIAGGARYSHSGYMYAEISTECSCGNNTEDVVLEAFNQQYCAMRTKQEDDLKREIIEFFRDKADELYSRLEDEYNYLTSDEAVWESIVANELDKEDEDETL